MIRGVIYARYSEGPRQTDQSIEGQVADCRAYADAHGIEIIGIYADRHISGTSTEGRDEFLRMMHDADRRAFDCIVTWKIDRFGRSREDIALNKIRLRKAGVTLHYAKESVPDGPEGILLESLLEGLAEYYSADLRQKVTRGQRESAKKGRMSSGALPIGYERDPETKMIRIKEAEAAAVRKVFAMYPAGASVKELQGVISEGVGRKVCQSVVWRMLRNEHYWCGYYMIQDIKVPCPPILTREEFETAGKHLKGRKQNAAGRASVDYLLSCKCHCEKCGTMLQGSSGRGKLGTVYYYYRCPKKGCTKPVPKDYLEDLVVRHTCEDILTDDMIEKLTSRIMEIQEAEQQGDPATTLKKELKDLKKKQSNIIAAIENGAGASLVSRLNEIEARMDELAVEIERAQLKRPVIPEEIVRGWLQSFRSGDKNDPTFRKRLLQTFVADVIVGPEAVTIVYNTNEKEPSTSVCVRPSEWSQCIRTQTPEIIDGRIVLRIRLVQK